MDAILIIYAVNVFRRNAGPPLLASAGNASRAVPSNNNKPLTLLQPYCQPYHTLLTTLHFIRVRTAELITRAGLAAIA